MLSRPTTQQLLDECAREVRDSLLPGARDATQQVMLEMMEQVLRACALRSAHEIAWIQDEIAAVEAYAESVVGELPDAAPVAAALTALRDERTDSLHLDDRVADYDLAGEVLSAAVEAAMAAEQQDLVDGGVALLHARRDREAELRPDFRFPGRS